MGNRSTYKILALWDSVMWGQWLEHDDKFVHIIADTLEKKSTDVSVSATILAHSGANLDENQTEKTEWKKHPYLYGELPRSRPNTVTQAHIARLESDYLDWLSHDTFDFSSSINHKDTIKEECKNFATTNPNLVLVNGAINNFNAMQILLPVSMTQLSNACKEKNIITAVTKLMDSLDFTESEFKSKAKKCCYTTMLDTLVAVWNLYPNSQIVTPGYYPLFSEKSCDAGSNDIAAFIIMLYAAATPDLCDNIIFFSFLVAMCINKKIFAERSKLWVDESNKWLKKACEDANTKLNTNRFHFVAVSFWSKAAFTDGGFVFDIEIGKIKSFSDFENFGVDDDMKKNRKAAWDLYYPNTKSDTEWTAAKDYRASIGHPNKKGSQQYATDILNYITKHQKQFWITL